MVDLHSRYKIYAVGYTTADPRQPAKSYRDLYKTTSPRVFSASRPVAHDCRSEPAKDLTSCNLWETQILSHGLRQTVNDVNALRIKPQRKAGKQLPEKLLFQVGFRGEKDGEFLYPRSTAVAFNGDVVVADTDNDRIQIFNSFGVFVRKFGVRGNHPGELMRPNCVCVSYNDDIAVTEMNSRRVQIFDQHGAHKLTFGTRDQPCSVDTDIKYRFYIGTTSKTVEIYDRNGQLIRLFPTTTLTPQKYSIFVRVNDHEEIIVCDSKTSFIKYFSIEGTLKSQFHIESTHAGLSVKPSAICLSTSGEILIADSLNHTINVYNAQGEVVRAALGPTDKLGTVQSCCLAPEGHLVVTEFSIAGDHTLKIFRFTDCACHFWRPGSSKRRERDPFYPQLDYESALTILKDV